MIFMPLQCRMARAALGLGIRELALAAKVAIDTITRFERGDQLKERTTEAIQRALEAAGVEFTNGEQPGVRLTKAAAAQLREGARNLKTAIAAKKGGHRAAQRPKERRSKLR
jgi:transcriptional regulator with XRE-family HTH domain